MTVDEIKNQYTMRDIVERYGFHPDRAGFISCPFHSGDHTPSMKIYKNDFHCHACGANGDIFTFVQKMDNCDFKTAFYSLGGTYRKPSFSSNLAIYRAQNEKKKREKRQMRIKKKAELNNMLLTIYADWMKRLEPYSDAWCDCVNAYTYCLYVDEELQNEMEGGRKS